MSAAGNKIIGAAQAHFAGLGVRQLEVPEWQCTLFCKPLTLSEHEGILREGATAGGREYGYAKAIIDKAVDADGKPLFDLSHRIYFTKALHAPVVRRIGEWILSGDQAQQEPLGKGETQEERDEGNS